MATMNWKEFSKFDRTKLFILIALFVITIISGFIIGRFSDSSNVLSLASYIFFPLQIEYFFNGIFKMTIQDSIICIFPGCEAVITLLTIIVSVSIYYILSLLIYYLWKK